MSNTRRSAGNPFFSLGEDPYLANPVMSEPLTGAELRAIRATGNPIFGGELYQRPTRSLREYASDKAYEAGLAMGLPGYAGSLRSGVEDAVDFVPGLGDVAGAQDAGAAYQRGDYGQAAVNGAAALAGTVPGVGDLGGAAIKSIFAGIGAKTADRAALMAAEDLASAGADADTIWKETGWFKGADDKWRFEIDDNVASVARSNPSHRTVSDAVEHSELMGAYPALNDIEIEPYRRGGSYSRGYPEDGIPPTLKTDYSKSNVLHELQHGVQDVEGFAAGGNNYSLKPGTPGWDLYQERIQAILTPMSIEDYARQAGFDGDAKEAAASYKEYADGIQDMRKSGIPTYLDRAAQDTAVNEAYRRLAGEVEARNVQTRMSMTADERRAKAPWTTEDVPRADQIVRRGGLGPMFSVDDATLKSKTIDEITEAAKAKGVSLSLSENKGKVTVNKIVVPKEARGQGVGTQVMREITDFADASGKTLALTPSTDFGGSSKAALERFYKRHGFEKNGGKTRDFEILEAMRRYPKERP